MVLEQDARFYETEPKKTGLANGLFDITLEIATMTSAFLYR